MILTDYLAEVKKYLNDQGVPDQPEAVVILGSGLGGFGEMIQNSISIPYSSIPGFPTTSIQGHSGELISGTVSGKQIIAFSGRFHHYEGYPFERTVLPVYVAKALNTKKLIISNAAGAINTGFKVGDLMVIDDVIRPFHNVSPLGFEKFRYSHYQTAERVRNLASEIGLPVQRGNYLFVNGPNYETKAEIRAFRVMGVDVVGMSTVPELMEASRLDIPAAAITMVTNMASGVTKGKLDHSDVKDAADRRKDDFARLVTVLIEKL